MPNIFNRTLLLVNYLHKSTPVTIVEQGPELFNMPLKRVMFHTFVSAEATYDNMFYLMPNFVKRIRIRSFSGPYFPGFGLNTERCFVFIQSECGKKWIRKTPNTDTFHAV